MRLAVSPGSVGDVPFVDFSALLLRLVDSQTRFVVIGGVAMCLQGTADVTFDLDVAVSNDSGSSRQVVDTFGAYAASTEGYCSNRIIKANDEGDMFVGEISLRTGDGPLDLLRCRAGEEGCLGLWNRSTISQVGDSTLRVASVEDLIALKRAADLTKDREHIMQLQALTRLLNAEFD